MEGIGAIPYESIRCDLFKKIAFDTWNDVNFHHHAGIDIPEIGITARIIATILNFRNRFRQNFDVFIKPGYKEQTYGGDIDLFIETDPNRYFWFALQAKVLKCNKTYKTLRKPPGEIQQWEKLKRLEKIAQCKGLYLLYNGMDNYDLQLEIDCCFRRFSYDQYGCSIVSLNDIERLANTTNSRGQFISPHFDDFHPGLAEPWKVLVCCYLDKSDEEFKLYSREEIEKDSNTFYPTKEEWEVASEKVDFYDQLFATAQSNADFDNRISRARVEAKWLPDYKVVIQRTDNKQGFD